DLDRLLPLLRGSWPAGLIERYAPRQQVRPGEPVLLQRQEHGQLEVGLALWGCVPDWCKDPSSLRRPINARSETVAEKPFFRGAWRHRRALLPADGFYEWQPRRDPDTGHIWKQPWLFRRRDRAPFWLGGLWDRWLGADGGELETAVILTTAPNDLLRRVHDRMPVVIPEGLEEAWLAALDGPALRALEPLLDPWDPAAWEALRLPAAPPAATRASPTAAAPPSVAETGAVSGASTGRPAVPRDALRQGELPLGLPAGESPAARPEDPTASP
ncbi:MAG: SOS response-associated peptidase, partial [Synechococcaceae cyanobacterium]